jgi:thiosulfate/3-mercaptopyruvate sulfurtransferase
MAVAHDGIVRDPDPAETCGTCHAQTVADAENSLHTSLQGYLTAFEQRSDEQHMPQLMEAYDNHCAGCHASCGQCHVSRPTSAGGGLLDGHVFRGTPPPYTTCTGCHGSRIENEYKGRNEDEEGARYPADVHYNPGGMNCNDCHTADEMHGATGEFDHRYDGAVIPSCTDSGCHEDISSGGNGQHTEGHLERLACQVCHSITYKNCYDCHVQLSDEGTPYFRTEESQMAFQIGYNTIQSEDRPWEYVPVRHVPISRDSFEFYGEDLLPNFDNRPTWTYATPHNIQRQTPQNSSCEGCHSSTDLFLTEADVAADELAANQAVIVAQAPSMSGSDAEEPVTEPTEEPSEEPTAEPTEEPSEPPTELPTGDEEVPAPEEYSGPETCGECHSDRYELWITGPHAHALDDPIFQEAWAASDNAPYCLACHTTGYNPNTGEYALEAVTCEACHGPYDEDHPPGVVQVDQTGEVCRNCHPVAYEEWLGSRHGQIGTRCTSCHRICTLETMRADDGHAVCEICHDGDAEHFHQSTHNSEDLDCVDCHMHPGPGEVGHGGTDHIAHNFMPNSFSCIDCHGETIHMDNKIVDLEADLVSYEETDLPELQEQAAELESEVETLRANVAGRLYAGLVGGGIVALLVGFAAGQMWRRWQSGKPI